MSALSPTARREYYLELGNSLPLPVVDQPENREPRLTAALEAFDALCPGDAYEGRLAVQIVLCGAHAAECLHEAGVYRVDYAKRTRCRAQAATMMREERAARRMLAQEQKVRLAGEAVANPPEEQPVPVPLPQAEPPALPPVQAEAATQPVPVPQPAATAPSPEAIAQAQAFAQKHKAAAAWIRNDRGVTRRCRAHFRRVTMPTDPAVIDALVRGAGVKTLGAAA